MQFVFEPHDSQNVSTRASRAAMEYSFEFAPTEAPELRPVSSATKSHGLAPSRHSIEKIDPTYARRRGIEYVDQQRAIIESNHAVTVGIALAGTGKTTTAVGFTDARPGMRTVYLAFNAENAAQGRRRFGSHVVSRTPHSIAFAQLNDEQRGRVTQRWNATAIRTVLQLKSPRAAAIVWSIINDFCVSDDMQFDPSKHGYSAIARLGVDHDAIVRCIGYARKLWQMMWTSGSGAPIPHDAYFKRFAMMRPNLGVDLIVFDEAQDANPVTTRLVRDQFELFGSKILYLGDEHQSIYAFRGASNAMRDLPDQAHCYPLTQSWRFGPHTANKANLILGELKGAALRLEGMGQDNSWNETGRYAYLARTNAELIAQGLAAQDKAVHWVGGIDRYRLDLLEDARKLSIHKHHEVQDRFMSHNFSSWSEYEQVAYATGDAEMTTIVKLVDEYGDSIPEIVCGLKKAACRSSDEAQVVLTTAHRAKGLEFDQVKVGEDFSVCDQAEQ